MNVYDLGSRAAVEFWPEVRGLLLPALEHNPFMDEEDVLHQLQTGMASLVVFTESGSLSGASVMEIIEYPKHRVARIFLLGGEKGFLKRMDEATAALKQWSKARGCDSIDMLGRPGLKVVTKTSHQQRFLWAWESLA